MLSDGAPLKRVMWKNTRAVAEQQFSATFAGVSFADFFCAPSMFSATWLTEMLSTCLMHM